MKNFILKELPPPKDLEIKAVLKQAADSHRYLAELKGISKTMPIQAILINTLLQGVRDKDQWEEWILFMAVM